MRSKLESFLITDLRSAKNIYIATALINTYGYSIIKENLRGDAVLKLLIGINLPTDAKVLKIAFESESPYHLSRIFNGRDYFHPKVYLMQFNDGTMKGYVGSANTTKGGLSGNVEMNIAVTDQAGCEELLDWFNEMWELGGVINEVFLGKYRQTIKNINQRIYSTKADVARLKTLLTNVTPQVEHNNSSPLQFFKQEHYDAYAVNNELDHSVIADQRRYEVKLKLRELDNRIFPLFGNYGLVELHRHSNGSNRISHHQFRKGFNKKEQRSIWLHYGYDKSEFENSFGDHPRMQVILHNYDVGVWLVVGKDNGSYHERTRFKNKLISDDNFRDYIFKLFLDLGDIYRICINGQNKRISDFLNSEELSSFLMKDQMRHYFMISREFSPSDPEISDDSIQQLVLEEFKRLYQLYRIFKMMR